MPLDSLSALLYSPGWEVLDMDQVQGLAAIKAARMNEADKATLQRRWLAGEPEAAFVVAALVKRQAKEG